MIGNSPRGPSNSRPRSPTPRDVNLQLQHPRIGRAARAVFSACLLALLMSGVTARAQIDTALDRTVWKMVFGLTEAQVKDPEWLARDDDADGVSNGTEFRAGTNPLEASSTFAIKSISA